MTDMEKVSERTIEDYEEDVYQEQKSKLRMPVTTTKPIFIKVMEYKAIIDDVTQIKVNLKEADDVLFRLEEFREEEEKQYKRWQSTLMDVQKKLIYADRSLFEKR